VSSRRAHSQTAAGRVPLWRLTLVIIGLFWFLAVLVFVVSQWVAPAFYSSTPSTTSFNFGTSFGLPFIKTWGLWVAGFLVVLGPFLAVWRALERGGKGVLEKALGTGTKARRRR
jgi:hypothetical protein